MYIVPRQKTTMFSGITYGIDGIMSILYVIGLTYY